MDMLDGTFDGGDGTDEVFGCIDSSETPGRRRPHRFSRRGQAARTHRLRSIMRTSVAARGHAPRMRAS